MHGCVRIDQDGTGAPGAAASGHALGLCRGDGAAGEGVGAVEGRVDAAAEDL